MNAELLQLRGTVRTSSPLSVDVVLENPAGAPENLLIFVEWPGHRPAIGEEIYVHGLVLLQRDSVIALRGHLVQRALGGVN